MKIAILTFLYMILASTFGIAKLVLFYGHPVFIIGVRMSLAGCLLLVIDYVSRRKLALTWTHIGLFIQLSLFHVYIAFIPEFWSLQYLSAAKACLMYSLSPFITAILEYTFFSKRLTVRQIQGMAIGFLGLTCMFITGENNLIDQPYEACSFLPELVLLCSVVSASYGWIILRELTVVHQYSLFFANGFGMLLAGIMALITILFIPGSAGIYISDYGQTALEISLMGLVGPQVASVLLFIGYILLLIVIANIVFYNMYGYLLRFYSPTFLSFAGFSAPLFAAVYDWAFFGVFPPGSFFIALLSIGSGLYLFYLDELT